MSQGYCKRLKKITLLLSYPSDEVGNHLVDLDALDENNINPYTDVLSEENIAVCLDIISIHSLVWII